MSRRLGGRQPLCGTGVTSLMLVIFSPIAFRARTADSRPGPGPLMWISTFFTPHSRAALRWPRRSGVWPFMLSSTYPLIRGLGLGRRGFHLDRGLARALARARVGARALPAHGQALAVARTAIAAQVHQALDRHRYLL